MADFLLDRGAVLEGRDPGGRTPLALAAMKGRVKTVELLLARGGAPGARDFEGRTPADLAGASGYAELAALLAKASSGR